MPTEKTPHIFLAYDGSINGDWVSRYAIRIAANAANKKLFLLHVLDGHYSPADVRLKIKAIEDECRFQHVELGYEVLQLSGDVAGTILESVPAGRENYCICGLRVTPRRKGFLTDTISAELLQSRRFNVLAFRVVHPGLLGCPREVLIPIAGSRPLHDAALRIFRLLDADLQKVHLLQIVDTKPWLLRFRSSLFHKTAKFRGYELIRQAVAALKQQKTDSTARFDGRVVISGDWVHETLVQASLLRARLILLEAPHPPPLVSWFQTNRMEKILRNTPCDVAIFRTV